MILGLVDLGSDKGIIEFLCFSSLIYLVNLFVKFFIVKKKKESLKNLKLNFKIFSYIYLCCWEGSIWFLTKVALHGPPVEKGNWLFLFLPFPKHFKVLNVRVEKSVPSRRAYKNNSRLQTFSDLKETKENTFIIATAFTFSRYWKFQHGTE